MLYEQQTGEDHRGTYPRAEYACPHCLEEFVWTPKGGLREKWGV
jgi:hypothetical protein